MPIYEYQGQKYEMSTTDPVAAKQKIMAHLGKSEAKPAPKETSGAAAFGKSAVESTLPSVGGFAGAVAGAEAGGTLGTAVAPMLGPAAPAGPVIGALGGGLVGGFGGAALVGKAQEAIMSAVPENIKASLGFGKEQRAAEEQQHPYASFAGQLAPNLLTMKPGLGVAAKARALYGAAGAGIEAGQELVQEGKIDAKKVAMAGAMGALATSPTKLGQKITKAVTPSPPIKAETKALPRIIEGEKAVDTAVERAQKYRKTDTTWDDVTASHILKDQKQLPTEPIHPTKTFESPKEAAKLLDDELYILENKAKLDEYNVNRSVEYMKESGLDKIGPKISDAFEGKQVDLSPQEQSALDSILKPTFKTWEEEMSKASSWKGKDFNVVDDVLPRYALGKGGIMDRIKGLLEEGSKTWAGGKGLGKSPVKSRTFHTLVDEQGNRTVVSAKGGKLFAWKDGEAHDLGKFDGTYGPGEKVKLSNGQEYSVKLSKGEETRTHTDQRFLDNGVEALLYKIQELKKFNAQMEFLDKITKAPEFKDHLVQTKGTPPEDWIQFNGQERIPQFKDTYFHPRLAEVLEDHLNPQNVDLGYFRKPMELINNTMMKFMFLNPLAHINNEALHYIPEKVAELSRNPGSIGSMPKTMQSSIADVLHQSPFYQDLIKNGAPLLSLRVFNEQFHNKRIQELAKAAYKQPGFKQVATDLGMKPIDLFQKISRESNKWMWATRDIMYIDAVRQTMDRGMPMKQAIAEVNKHMPAYRIPSRVLEQRWLSRVMKDPALTIFSHYHYGAMRSFGEYAKALTYDLYKNKNKPEAIKAAGQAAAGLATLGFMFSIFYPWLDKQASEQTGKQFTFRRPGGLHFAETAEKTLHGEATPLDFLRAALSPAPTLTLPMELSYGRDPYTGKTMYDWNPRKPVSSTAKFGAEMAAKTVPIPGKQIKDVATGKQSGPEALLSYFLDAKVQSREAARKQERAKKNAARKRKSQERKD